MQGDRGEEVHLPLVISSMQGKTQQLILQKRAGYEEADVLDELDSAGAFWCCGLCRRPPGAGVKL